MLFSSNDKFTNLSERTKLIAQKCSYQIRTTTATTGGGTVTTVSSVSAPNSPENTNVGNFPNFQTNSLLNVATLKENAKKSLRNLCNCSRETLKYNLPKRTNSVRSSTRWYVKQPTWRLWGEEREPDAIFTVYLKKVRYHRPTPSASSQDSDDEISHLEWETIRVRFVKAASLSRLVDSLTTDDGELESTFVNVFLATYRTFASLEEVFDLLVRQYEALIKETGSTNLDEAHKKTLVSALHVWLDGYPEDWNLGNIRRLLAFTSKHLLNSELHLKAERLHNKLTLNNFSPPPSPSSSSDSNTHSSCGYSTIYRIPPCHIIEQHHFPDISPAHFAEQLTRKDVELFKRLIPHQCLGATWAKHSTDKRIAHTVVATVNQWNAVSNQVISSILIEVGTKPSERAINISTWIDIAQELRLLKNFSSLKAVISGLGSHAIHRLSKSWACVSRDKLEIFDALSAVCSEDENAKAQREILVKEGTAKFANTGGEHVSKVIQKQRQTICHGTVPYLGTFLTDLTMIHTANPDFLPNGLINFDKRRKEFEILAQIKLLQGAANAYYFVADPLFDQWLQSSLVLDEKKQYELSCNLEPPTDPIKRPNNIHGHRKTDSIASNSSSGGGSQFYCDIKNISISSRNSSLGRDVTPPNSSMLSRTNSDQSLVCDLSVSSNGAKSTTLSPFSLLHTKNSSKSTSNLLRDNKETNGHPIINGQLVQSAIKDNSPNFYIIKVTYEMTGAESDGVVMYKSIMLGNNERTPTVIRNAMMKLGLEGDCDHYTLSQALPDAELLMPPSANVYYAVNTNYNLNFILRLKKDSQ